MIFFMNFFLGLCDEETGRHKFWKKSGSRRNQKKVYRIEKGSQGTDYYKRVGKHRCRQCGKEYRWMQSLIRHEKEECGKAPQHQCPFCGLRMRHKWLLKKHILNLHQFAL
ncbi:Similar to lola: Longitudinals lacking protein [Cotesia congregata]|uniref:Isoform G (Drosophila melanogaster) n=1 Tax=Cotesia congregata TaxID=51543 RepID=A0A8J2HHF3_COTCN|nr:Similar to lola: Longitudinals lacking protein [Cotesia congregata]